MYGHSCFGGHGKRSDIPVSEGISLDTQIPIVKLLRESNRELLNSQYNLRNYNTNNDYKMDNFLSELPKKNYQTGSGRLTGMEILRKWVEDFKKNHPTNQESDDDTFIKTINSETQNI